MSNTGANSRGPSLPGDHVIEVSGWRVEVEREDDGQWSAVVPDLPGCYTWSPSLGALPTLVADAIECCLDEERQHSQRDKAFD